MIGPRGTWEDKKPDYLFAVHTIFRTAYVPAMQCVHFGLMRLKQVVFSVSALRRWGYVLNPQYVHVITDERTAARMTVGMSCIGNNHRTPCRYKPNLNPDLHPQCILAFQSAIPFAGKDGGRYAY
jgi:hypothetical protein